MPQDQLQQELVPHLVSLVQILILQTEPQQVLYLPVLSPGTISATQDTAGSAFSFSQSYTQGDAVPTAAPTVGDVPNFSNTTSYTAGTAGTLAGTVTSAGLVTVTAGGAGSSGIGQFVSEITVID